MIWSKQISKRLESRCRVQDLYIQSIRAFKWEDMCLSANSLQQPVDNNLRSNQRNVTLANGNSKKSTADAVMRIRKNQQQLNFAFVKRMKLTITRSCKKGCREVGVETNQYSRQVTQPETCEFNSINCSLKPGNSTVSTAAVVHNYWEELILF